MLWDAKKIKNPASMRNIDKKKKFYVQLTQWLYCRIKRPCLRSDKADIQVAWPSLL